MSAGERAAPVPVRWGVLGCASIALKRVIPAMLGGRWSQVVAIASRDGNKARAAAAALGIPRAHGSYEALLADRDVEAIYIPLPNHLHVPWSIRAAEAGKHVLCEKPIALSEREARQLLAVRERTNVLIGEAFMVRSQPRWLAVRDLVAAGRIGELRLVTGHFSYDLHDPANIRSQVEWGGGALMDIGCYPITLARWLFAAEPLAVIAMVERDPGTRVDRLTSALMRFPLGQASFTCAGQLVPYQRMQLFGTRGRIEIEIPFNTPNDRATRILIDDGRDVLGSGIAATEFPPVDQYAIQGEQFSQAIRGLGVVPVPLEDAIANAAVIDALFRSAETGAWEAPFA